jgi:hypothetical protein
MMLLCNMHGGFSLERLWDPGIELLPEDELETSCALVAKFVYKVELEQFSIGKFILLNTAVANSEMVKYLHYKVFPASDKSACFASMNLVVPGTSISPGLSLGMCMTLTVVAEPKPPWPFPLVIFSHGLDEGDTTNMLQITQFYSKRMNSWTSAILQSWFQFCSAGKVSLYDYGTEKFQWAIAWPSTSLLCSIPSGMHPSVPLECSLVICY